MPKGCQICHDTRRLEMDRSLAAGASWFTLATTYQVNRSSLRSHFAREHHLETVSDPIPGVRAPAPADTDAQSRTVATYEQQVRTLETDLTTVDAQLTTLQTRRSALHDQRNQAHFLERWGTYYEVEEALTTLEAAIAAQERHQREVRLALGMAQRERTAATARYQEGLRGHWLKVKEHLGQTEKYDSMRSWCALVNTGTHLLPRPPVPPGQHLVELNYPRICQQLREEFPFDGGCPCQCTICTAPSPAVDPWADYEIVRP